MTSDDDDRGTPGGPAEGGGERDDELARLPRTPQRRSPVLAGAVIAVAALLLFHLRTDLGYALSSRTPATLGDAAKLARDPSGALSAALAAHANRYAALDGMPDYRDALLFEPKGDSYRRAFFPLLGTDGRIVVRAEQTQTRGDLGERFVGRLRPFREVPWAEQVRTYYATKVASTRLLDLAALQQRMLQSSGTLADALDEKRLGPLVDIGGEAVHVAPDQPLDLVVDFPDELRVTLSKEKFPLAEDARHELDRLLAMPGLIGPEAVLGPAPAPTAPTAGAPAPPADGFAFYVRTSRAGRDALLERLDKNDIRFALHQERVAASAKELSVQRSNPETLLLRGQPIAWSRVLSIHVAAPVTIPADAYVLVEGDAPGGYLWAPIVAGLLALFLAFNVWLLARSLRAPGPPAPIPFPDEDKAPP